MRAGNRVLTGQKQRGADGFTTARRNRRSAVLEAVVVEQPGSDGRQLEVSILKLVAGPLKMR